MKCNLLAISLAVLCLCFGKKTVVFGHSVTVHLQLSSPPTSYDCIGGEVGLSNTSIMLQYKMVQQEEAPISSSPSAATTALREWTDVTALKISSSQPSAASVTFSLDSSVQGIQFRLLQLEHGGGTCNCWTLDSMTVTLESSQAHVSLGIVDICFTSGDLPGQGLGTFCNGSAGEARGSVTRVFYFLGSNGSLCGSDNTLIDSQESSLPDDCSTVIPRL